MDIRHSAAQVDLTVDGVPAPQGSKSAYAMGKRAVLFDDNAKVLKPWRAAVTAAALKHPTEPLTGALWVTIDFLFIRPPSSRRPFPSIRPDIDKLARAILDSLTKGNCWHDDGQVVDLHVRQLYAPAACAHIQIGYVTQEESHS